MFRNIRGSTGLFFECAMNAASARSGESLAQTVKKAGCVAAGLSLQMLTADGELAQQVALPQRAMPIFSFRLSTPTAPITTCLPIT